MTITNTGRKGLFGNTTDSSAGTGENTYYQTDGRGNYVQFGEGMDMVGVFTSPKEEKPMLTLITRHFDKITRVRITKKRIVLYGVANIMYIPNNNTKISMSVDDQRGTTIVEKVRRAIDGCGKCPSCRISSELSCYDVNLPTKQEVIKIVGEEII